MQPAKLAYDTSMISNEKGQPKTAIIICIYIDFHVCPVLDEFSSKVNRRKFGKELFDRLLIVCSTINYKDTD
jgi:hypothetical protein